MVHFRAFAFYVPECANKFTAVAQDIPANANRHLYTDLPDNYMKALAVLLASSMSSSDAAMFVCITSPSTFGAAQDNPSPLCFIDAK